MIGISGFIRKLRTTLIARGVPPDDAEDVVQEAFARLEAYRRVHDVRSKEAFLVTAAINIATDQARRRQASPFFTGPLNVDLIPDATPQPDEILRAQERLRKVGAGLEQLDPTVRRILLAHRLEGATYPEIAARENMSVANVEKKVARAILFLMKWLDER